MKNQTHLNIASLLLAPVCALSLAILSCSTASQSPGITVTPLSAQPAKRLNSLFKSTPGILGIQSNDGLAHLFIKLLINETNRPLSKSFGVLNLPSSWNYEAIVDLFSPTANNGITTLTIPAAAFGAGPTYAASVAAPPLRPASDYQARIYLQDNGGGISTTRLAASQVALETLNAGANTLIFNLSLNDNGIVTVAGSGGTNADHIPATTASMNQPAGIAADTHGNLFIADQYDQSIRQVDASGIITTVAGNGSTGYSGDGGPATSAQLNDPVGVAIDATGNLFIADFWNGRIREVNTAGVITTVAGNGDNHFYGDGGPATAAAIGNPYGVCVDASDTLYFTDNYNGMARKVTAAGVISTLAGTGINNYNGDGSPATSKELNYPKGVAVDASGNVYIADNANERIRKVDTAGAISTVAGNGTAGYNGEGIAALSAQLNAPTGVALDAAGNIYFSEYWNALVRKLDHLTGVITTYAGNQSYGYGGDDGPAVMATLGWATGVALDPSGDLFLSHIFQNVVRKVIPAGINVTDVQINSSAFNNATSGNSIVKGDSVLLDTGVSNYQPGVSYLKVFLSGACYTAGRTLLGKLSNPATWQNLTWNTAANGVLPANYVAGNLNGGAGVAANAGQVDVEAYDLNNVLLGTASFSVNIYGTPSITLVTQ